METTGCVRVIRAMNLPKTDMFSKIDAYVVVQQNGRKLGKTKAVSDNEDPVWDQVFPITLIRTLDGKVSGHFELQLFDKNTFKDQLVGHINVDVSTLNPQQLSYVELPLVFATEKLASQQRNSRIGLTISPGILSYASLRTLWGAAPGLITNDAKQKLYLPIPDPQVGCLYLGIEYEGPEVDFKVYVMNPNASLFVDMSIAGRARTKVVRRQYPRGNAIAPGLVAYQEVKLDDVPVSSDFNTVSIMVFDSAYLSGTNASHVVRAHGWQGSLNFEAACRKLVNIDVDHKEQEIYMTVDHGETMLLVDWDEDDVDIKLAVLANPATLDKGYELTLKGQACKKDSEIFVPPKQALGGKYQIARIYELDDVEYGTAFKDMEIIRYQLHNMRMYNVQTLTRIMG